MQLDDIVRRASAVAKRFLDSTRGGKLLVVVMEEFSVRGVLVRKKAKGGLELLRFLEVPFETSVSNPKLKLAHLFKAWGEIPAKQLLIVTDEFTCAPAELPKPKPSKFAPHKAEAALKAAAQYEIGPFLEYPAAEAMIAVYVQPPRPDELDEFGIDESTTLHTLVFAYHAKSYNVLKQVCDNLKIKLVGVVPQEIFAFAKGGEEDAIEACLVDDEQAPKVMVNWRAYDAVAALVVDDVPTAFVQRHFEAEESVVEALMDAVGDACAESVAPLDKEPLILLGGEGAEQEWRESLKEAAPGANVKGWDAAVDLCSVHSPGPVPARYMTALTAAQHATHKDGGAALVNDRVPFAVKAVAHPLAVPAMVLLAFFLCLGADFGWLKLKTASMESTVAELEERKETVQAAADSKSGVLSKFDALKKQQREVKNKIDLVENQLAGRHELMQAFFAGLIDETPNTIQLSSIRQFSEQVWFLEGVAQRYDVVSKYVVQLKNLPMTKQCRLESSSEKVGAEAGEGVCRFSLRIRLEEG